MLENILVILYTKWNLCHTQAHIGKNYVLMIMIAGPMMYYFLVHTIDHRAT